MNTLNRETERRRRRAKSRKKIRKKATPKRGTVHSKELRRDPNQRPEWDDWFMSLCFVVSQKSLDPHTKHGAIVIDADKTILSIGYNSPPRGCVDADIPLTRPEKYRFMEHSESNAINNAARTGTSLKGSTFYVTGHPCEECLRKIINVGAKKVIYGPIGSSCIVNESWDAIHTMLRGQQIEMVEYQSSSLIEVSLILTQTSNYMRDKLDGQETTKVN